MADRPFKGGVCYVSNLFLPGVVALSCRWLLEVNSSPSYLASCPEDYEMKFRLLEDTLNVVDIERR